MRSATSTANEENLKSNLQSAKKVAKKAKAAYKAKVKEQKVKIKPLKDALKEAKNAVKAAKLAYKAAIDAIKPPTAEESAAPRKRGRQPGFSPKAAKAEPVTAAPTVQPTAQPVVASKGGNDNLTKVKGVGENIANMLKANGITTYADMAATSFERYKELLKANGMSKFRDPSQWAARAAVLAAAPPKQKAAPKAATKVKVAVNLKEQKEANQKAAAKAGGDNLTKVKGVGENISVMLKANGITTYADMAATSFERYKELLKANGMSKFRDPSHWAERAAVLAAAPPKQRKSAQPMVAPTPAPKQEKKAAAPAPKAAKNVVNHEEQKAANTQKAATAGGDDLTKVKGVGDNIAVMLKANGIVTYGDMAATSFERYKELLKANGMSKFRDPSQWAARAAELAKTPSEPAAAPKKRGRQPGFSPKAAAKPAPAKPAAAADAAAAPRKRGRQPGFSPKAAKAAATAPVVQVANPAPAPAQPAPKAPAKPKAPPAKPDDLTQVKGVGQRVAEALNKEGIYTYKDMAEVSVDRYKEILKENNMSKFRDPSDWARLAGELAGKR